MEVPSPSRWTDKHTLIVLIVMLVGGVLAATWPIWFAPPNVSSTLTAYLILLVLWLPLLIILALGHEGATGSFIFLMVAGVIVAIIALSLGGPNLSAGAYQAKDCTSVETSPGQTEYTCKLRGVGLGVPQTLVLEGSTGSPFVHVVK